MEEEKPIVINYMEIPEQAIVEESIEASKELDDENNEFLKCLRIAEVYKQAGMDPLYIMDRRNSNIFVKPREYIGYNAVTLH